MDRSGRDAGKATCRLPQNEVAGELLFGLPDWVIGVGFVTLANGDPAGFPRSGNGAGRGFPMRHGPDAMNVSGERDPCGTGAQPSAPNHVWPH